MDIGIDNSGYSPEATQWWQSILSDPGQIDTFKFGGRNIHLYVDEIDITPEEFDIKAKKHPELIKKIGWSRPNGPVRIYRVRAGNWGGDYDLCADSYISDLDAYLKALCYSELHDLGWTNSNDGPEDKAYIHQVPHDFPFYPSNYSEEHPDLTA
jgi:hypothetical protein